MKKFRLKKAMACITAAAMLAGLSGSAGVGMTAVHAEGIDDHLILDFDFENLTAGSEITGGGAKATGSYSLQDSYAGAGKALYLDGTSQFLNATKEDGTSLLAGLKEMTVSFEMKSDRTATNWPFYAAPSTTTQPIGGNGRELYFGLLVNGGNITAERYLNGRSTCASTAMNSEWSHVDVVVSESDTTIYIDGIEKSRVESTNGLDSILGSSPILQIGKANWGNGEYCKGWIDNMKVYDKALTAEEVQQVVSDAYAGIVIAQTAATIQDVTLDDAKVVLPDYDGAVTWKSSMPEVVIEENGLTAKVTQPAKGEEALTGKLTAVISKSNCTVIFINQLREKVGVMFGSPETTTGGRALKFYSSVRLDVRRIEALKQSGETIGNRTRVKVVKNKIAPPFKEAEFDIIFGEGISTVGDILDLAADAGIVNKSGAWYAYEGNKIGQGRENTKQYLKEHTEMLQEIEQKVRAHYGLQDAKDDSNKD